MFLNGEPITRRRPATTTDDYGNTVLNWASVTDTVLTGWGIAPTASFEPATPDRNAVESDFSLFGPFGSDIRSTDRLIVRGLVCEVAGRPQSWHSPFTGWDAGVLILAKIVEG